LAQIYGCLLAELQAGRPAVTATIVRRQGSAPRNLGSWLVLRQDGSLAGSVGGGLLEAEVVTAGRELFQQGRARLLNFDLKGEGAEAIGMICGGLVDVYIEYFDPSDKSLVGFLSRLDQAAGQARPAALALALDQDRPLGRRHLIRPEGVDSWPEGPLPSALEGVRRRIEAGQGFLRPGLVDDWLVAPLGAAPTVYIFGGGHVSAQIAPLAALVDFKVVVTDDRPEFAAPERFPSAEEVVCRPFEGVVEALKPGKQAYLVIVTRGHRHDGLVLAQALRSPAAYVGMIGSRRKLKAISEALLAQGFSQEDLDRVHSPIGLNIGAETPEEIAVSIVAELIQARAELAGEGKGKKEWEV